MIAIDLSGHGALVTGAAQGIGLACATALADAGAEVVGLDLAPAPGVFPGTLVVGDVTDGEARQAALAQLDRSRPAVLVNNAALQLEKRLPQTSPAELRRTFEVNAIAPALLAVEFAEGAVPDSSVVNMASVLALTGDPGLGAYTAAKGAVANLTRTLALEFAGRLRVNAVCPGAIRTPLTTRIWDLSEDPQRAEQRMTAVYPVGRIGEPADVGAVVAFLASPLAGFVNGALVTVDGGLLAGNPEWALDRL